MTDQSLSRAHCLDVEREDSCPQLLKGATDEMHPSRPSTVRGACSEAALGTHWTSHPIAADCTRALATLIAGAVATFDTDRSASRRYLTRASAVLQACAGHEYESAGEERSRGGLAHWRLTRVLDYVEQHLTEKITAATLAEIVGVSVGQLFRAFRASVGMPPLRYVASRRLEVVCQLLGTTAEPLSQVAISAGFCDQSHLCRAFRREMGVTPAVWRRRNATAPNTNFANRMGQGAGDVALGGVHL